MQAFIPRQQARGFIIPHFISENNTLSSEAKYLYGVLCDYARDKVYCYPSKQTLANRLNCSINSIKKYLKQLIEMGFLRAEMSLKMGKEIFRLFCPPKNDTVPAQASPQNPAQEEQEKRLQEVPQEAPAVVQKNFNKGCQNLTGGASKFDGKANVNLNNINPPTPHEQEQAKKSKRVWDYKFYNLEFQNFWNLYPKKERREDARQAWFKLSRQGKIPTLDILKKALDYFSDNSSWHRENGRYVPHAVNFLFGLRWLDLPQEAPKDQEKSKVLAVPVFETPKAWQERKQREEKERVEEQAKEQARLEKINMDFEKFKKFFAPVHDNLQYNMGKILFSVNYENITMPTEKQEISLMEFLKQRGQACKNNA